jgi:hypothetical protein
MTCIVECVLLFIFVECVLFLSFARVLLFETLGLSHPHTTTHALAHGTLSI